MSNEGLQVRESKLFTVNLRGPVCVYTMCMCTVCTVCIHCACSVCVCVRGREFVLCLCVRVCTVCVGTVSVYCVRAFVLCLCMLLCLMTYLCNDIITLHIH